MQIIEQGVSQEQFSRRELLRRGVRFGAAAVATPAALAILEGCGANIPQTPKTYNGEIEDLKGLDLITDERFKTLTDELIGSGQPLLEKIGRESRLLHDSSSNPDDISLVTNEDTTPLPITRDYSGLSKAITLSPGYEEEIGFGVFTAAGTTEYQYSLPAALAIHIGITKNLEKRPLLEAFYLAKEHLSHTLAMRLYAEYGNNSLGVSGMFLEPDGTPMENKKHLFKAGYTLGLDDATDPSSQLWRITDQAPVIMMAPSIVALIREGKVPVDEADLSPFYTAAHLIEQDPELIQLAVRLSDDWAASEDMKGPDGFSDEIFHPKILALVEKLCNIWYPGGKMPEGF